MHDISPPLRNWAGNLTYGPTRLHRPTTLDELRRTVSGSPRIRALGTGHSFSRAADTTAELVRLDRMPDTVRIDAAAGTVEVSAGTTYAHLASRLHPAGFALANLASLPHISVAGSCSTGTHGSGETQRSLAAAVRAVQLVGADGDLVELDRDRDPAGFPGAVVALGALGIVTRLTLDIEPAYEVAQRVRLDVPLDEITARLDEVFAAAYSVSVFTSWRTGRASVFLKRRTDRPAGTWAGGHAATAPVHPVPEQPADNCTEQGDRPGPWHERLPHFRPEYVPGSGVELQSEYFLPRESAAAAITALRGLADMMAPVLQISELRAVRGDELWLSPAYGRDTVTVHFTWVDDLAAVTPVIEAVEERLRPFQPRPHWGKLTRMRPDEIVAAYPRATDFAKLVETMDPDGTFGNAFVEALFPRV
ncbi:FAD-binding protein [Micromonospora sp. NPDC049230]|uniref:FAD-binding protein n=1 Tax=Micromonospora sp. NPDC049230 TaxID=3155502 RepID=UPI0033D0D11B